jgi:hypothetical protein
VPQPVGADRRSAEPRVAAVSGVWRAVAGGRAAVDGVLFIGVPGEALAYGPA